ncbi:MAG: hypothetical protein A3H32_20345 [Betaproteobacteria bacterium RIFCSPLOWO2_02_FULL_63_19]|nr:MAG: hypothetical protein A3H32_20345 [Betaproteobacteria bacterium RIFCSPLOWO2_02_FULL_63_19]
MTRPLRHGVVFCRRATPLLIAASLSACSVLTLLPGAKIEEPASTVIARQEPAATESLTVNTVNSAQTSASDSASRKADAVPAPLPQRPRAAGGPDAPVRLPPLEIAGLDEIREVKDPLPIARTIDLTATPDDLWERIRNGFGMRNLSGPLVLDRQIWYASRPSLMKNMLQRSRRYLYHIVEELERRGIPTELALLPMVESAFNPMAYSRAKASGLWQFIPSTARTYNLKQNWWIDARRDIIASTAAALDYLQFLYEMHGDWYLALASYNWGENAVSRAIERNKARGQPTDYLSLRMPAETRYYVPKLQALKNIVSNPKAFGIDLDPIPNEPYFVTVEKKQDIDIRTAAKLAEMSLEELIALNPAYNRPVITAAQSQTLVLPADHVDTFRRNLENHDKPLSAWRTYTLKPGDGLARVAKQHGISLARLMQVNGIRARTRVGTGQQILVPEKGNNAAKEPLPALFRPSQGAGQSVRTVYTVRNGDSFWAIARRFGVRIDDLKRWNSIERLLAGHKILVYQPIAVEPESVQTVYTVKKGDSFWAIARRFGVRIDDLKRWNSIDRLFAGDKVVIYQATADNTGAVARNERKSKAATESNGKKLARGETAPQDAGR